MQRPRVDPHTASTIHNLIEQCRASGRDIVRALDERGHLSFPALDSWQSHCTLEAMAVLLDASSVDAVMRALPDFSRPMTPFDTKRVIVAWLRVLAQQQLQRQPTTEENPK